MPNLTWEEIDEKIHFLKSERAAANIQIKHYEKSISILKQRAVFIQNQIDWWEKLVKNHEEEET